MNPTNNFINLKNAIVDYNNQIKTIKNNKNSKEKENNINFKEKFKDGTDEFKLAQNIGTKATKFFTSSEYVNAKPELKIEMINKIQNAIIDSRKKTGINQENIKKRINNVSNSGFRAKFHLATNKKDVEILQKQLKNLTDSDDKLHEILFRIQILNPKNKNIEIESEDHEAAFLEIDLTDEETEIEIVDDSIKEQNLNNNNNIHIKELP